MAPLFLTALLVSAAQAQLTPDRVEQAIRLHIADRIGVDPEDVELSSLGLARGLRCGDGAVLEVQSAAGEQFLGHPNIRVIGRQGAEVCEQLRLRPEVRLWRELPVAARTTQPGERVVMRMERVQLQQLSGRPVGPEVGPFEAVGVLREGTPVTWHRVHRVPDARSGARVTLVAGTGGLLIKAPGKLLEDATVGDTVRVANLATGVVVEGVLRAGDVVEARGVR